MSFGSPKWIAMIMKAVWYLGINTIDTANTPTANSNDSLPRFIKKYHIPRHQIVIVSKCLHIVPDNPRIHAKFAPDLCKHSKYVNQEGLSHSHLNAVDAPYLDLLQIHRYDSYIPAEETLKGFHDIVESGKVRYIGTYSMRCWQFAHLDEVARRHGWATFVSMQDEYSLLYREEMLAYCKFHGIDVIPWSPLAAGELAHPGGTRKLSEADKGTINRVGELANRKGVKMTGLDLPKGHEPHRGCRVEENIVTSIVLTSGEVAYLEAPYLPKPVRGHD